MNGFVIKCFLLTFSPNPQGGANRKYLEKSFLYIADDFNKCKKINRSFYSKWLPLGGWGENVNKKHSI